MQLELFSSDQLVYMKPYGDISQESVGLWNELSAKYYSNQPVVLMDLRHLSSVSISVPEFISLGHADQQGMAPVLGIKVAYLADSDLIFGFARVIESVWQAIVQVSVFREMDATCEWLGIEEAVLDQLELLVRQE